MAMKSITLILASCLVLAASGCSTSTDTKNAKQAVEKFHQQLDGEKFNEIYDASSKEFKKATSREEMVALLEAIHRKLGNIRSANSQGWNVNYNTSGSSVILTYATEYEGGKAEERFSFRLDGDEQPLLLSYNINSIALIIK